MPVDKHDVFVVVFQECFPPLISPGLGFDHAVSISLRHGSALLATSVCPSDRRIISSNLLIALKIYIQPLSPSLKTKLGCTLPNLAGLNSIT